MINELKTFITVVEQKNFTKAAELLNLSQPSVSVHIKNLEQIFDAKLISRSVKQKKIIITDSGYKLYGRAKEILALIDTTKHELTSNATTVKGSITIGSSFTIGEYLLPDFLTYFTEKYPEIEVKVLMNNTTGICNSIKELAFDLGLIEGPPTYGNLNQACFYKDDMVLAYPSSEKSITSLQQFTNRCWLAREDGSGTREYLNMFLSQYHIIPKKIMILGSNYAIKEAVTKGLGTTIISDLVISEAKKEQLLSVYPLDDHFTRYFSYITPKNVTLSQTASLFLDELIHYYSLS